MNFSFAIGLLVIMRMKILNKMKSIIAYLIYLVITITMFDVFVLHNIFGLGYPHHYEEENIQRFPSPYVEFTGKPNVMDHNEFGFRGDSFVKVPPDVFKIAFWGGSTGYNGSPPIAKILERELAKRLKQSVFVANYSVVSSNHRQHLHGIIEFLPQFKPDLIIFYGGYNETIQSAHYDPRPGYPYNFFYRSETKPFVKLLLRNSAIIGEIDKKIGVFTGMNRLKKEQQPFSQDWNKRIVDKYFETLILANNIADTIESSFFGRTRYMAFYQPYQVPVAFAVAHHEIKERIKTIPYIFDVSSQYDPLGKEVYLDSVHVNQKAKEVMGKKIADIVVEWLTIGRHAVLHPAL